MPFDFSPPERRVDPVVREPWRDVLLDAAEIVRQRGFRRCGPDSLDGDKGGVCVLQAIALAAGGTIANMYSRWTPTQRQAVLALASHLDVPHTTTEIFSWNDQLLPWFPARKLRRTLIAAAHS